MDTDRLAEVRRYVANNRDVWGSDRQDGSRAAMLSHAYTDIYQKVLNVIDTGNPLVAVTENAAELCPLITMTGIVLCVSTFMVSLPRSHSRRFVRHTASRRTG